jgi:hypothetical protein
MNTAAQRTLSTAFCILLSLFILNFSSANTSVSKNSPKFINQDNWEVGGSLDFSKSYIYTGGYSFSFDPKGSYFFRDKFSAGLFLNTFWRPGHSNFSFGTMITNYFWEKESLAAYVSLATFFEYLKYYMVTVGVKHFFAPSVSFGIGVNQSLYLWNIPYGLSPLATTSINSSFSVYF